MLLEYLLSTINIVFILDTLHDDKLVNAEVAKRGSASVGVLGLF